MKSCAACHQKLDQEAFSARQQGLKQEERRCKECIKNNKLARPMKLESSSPTKAEPKHPVPINEGDLTCWICLDGDASGALRRDCSCRGSSGHAHLACLTMHAASESNNIDGLVTPSDRFDKLRYPWKVCPNCKQRYQGRLRIDMANGFIAFVERVYKNKSTSTSWFCEVYPKEFLTLESLAGKLDAVFSANQLDSVRETSVQILVMVERLQSERRMMEEHQVYIIQLEADANHKLALSYPDYHPRKKQHLEKAAALFKSPILSFSKHCASVLAKIETQLAQENKEDETIITAKERAAFHQHLQLHGPDHFISMQMSLALACRLRQFHHSVEGERMMVKLLDSSRRIYGPHHHLTEEIEVYLRVMKTRLVRIFVGDLVQKKVFQALRYEDDGTKCVVRLNPFQRPKCLDPLTFGDMVQFYSSLQKSGGSGPRENEETMTVKSKDIAYLEGTVVLCHVSRGKNNGYAKKIGMVTGHVKDRSYNVCFEDTDLKQLSVHHDNTRIVFDLARCAGTVP
jgi:hypothetical protein